MQTENTEHPVRPRRNVKFTRFMRYITVSGLSFILTILLTALFHESMGFSERLAYALTLLLVFISNVGLTLTWIIPQHDIEHSLPSQILRCILISSLSRAIEWCIFFVLQRYTPIYYLLIIVIISVASFLAKFWALNRFVGNKNHNLTR